MIANAKKTTKTYAGKKITSKNAKMRATDNATPPKKITAKVTESPPSAKKTIAKGTTKQAVSKETSDTTVQTKAKEELADDEFIYRYNEYYSRELPKETID